MGAVAMPGVLEPPAPVPALVSLSAPNEVLISIGRFDPDDPNQRVHLGTSARRDSSRFRAFPEAHNRGGVGAGKIHVESFRDEAHLNVIVAAVRAMASRGIAPLKAVQ